MKQVGVSTHLLCVGLIVSRNNDQQLGVDNMLTIQQKGNILSLNQESTAPCHANVKPTKTGRYLSAHHKGDIRWWFNRK